MWLRSLYSVVLSHRNYLVCLAMDTIEDKHNVLYSLPASLVHDIMSEWIDCPCIVKLDEAVCQHIFRGLHLEILSSEQFNISKLAALSQNFDKPNPLNPSADAQRLHWLAVRNVKVRELELAYNCDLSAISNYLSKFGDRGSLTPDNKNEVVFTALGFMGVRVGQPSFTSDKSQSKIIATHCKKLTSYHCYMLNMFEEGFLRVLSSNPGLQELRIEGDYMGAGNAAAVAQIRLPNLRQLVFMTKYGFDDVLSAFVKAAPNLEKLQLCCNSCKFTELTAGQILTVGQRCPKLRSFSSRELDLGADDHDLKWFLQACPSIVNLDLKGHTQLTDDNLIAALSWLPELHSLNLTDCGKLTDRTLLFLAESFAHTLQVLHIGGSEGMSSGAIDVLLSKCTQLHTYHNLYSCVEGELDVDKLKQATILQVMYLGDDADLTVFATHGQQLQVLDLFEVYRDKKKDLFSAAELLEVARACPNLRIVVESTYAGSKVDYSIVKKAFPKILFTTDKAHADFDAMAMPV